MKESITGLFRDEGGMIPTGQSVVTNETGRPEAVLNWQQVERIRGILGSLNSIDQVKDLAEIVGGMASTGIYDPRAAKFGISGEDDELIVALWSAREQWASSTEAMRGIVTAAGEKAVTGYRDEAIDFLGFKGVFDAVMGIKDAFDPSKAQSTSMSDTGPVSAVGAVSTDPGAVATGDGVSQGKSLVYGDPNKKYITSNTALTTEMPDLDRKAPPGTGAERWRPMMIDALRNQGMNDWANNPAIVDRFIRQIDTESGGDENISQQIVDVNGTGDAAGVGLGQMIPGTWAAYRDPKLPDDRRNGWAMLNAMARYVRGRYGDNGYESIGNGIGYDRGGIANGVGLMAKATISPERVLSPSQTGAFENWMNSGAAAANIGPEMWEAVDDMLVALPSAAQFQKIAALADNGDADEGSAPARNGGPLVVIEKLEARDEEAAMRAAMREANRVSRSASIAGGWR